MEYLAKRLFLVIFSITFFLIFFLDVIIGMKNGMIRAVIAAGVAVFLSPRKKKISTQTGEKTQITWIFLKKPIILD
tara:strand:+ start:4949 stop:5176 length:228 start_codon:yes stop_codon:yes gene_type:complete